MSTAVWPPISPEKLAQEEEASRTRELEWLLLSLQETLASVKSGLEECVALLAPREPGSTLVLSSPRSDSIKGFVTRLGTRIIRGDIHVKMYGLQPTKGQSSYKLSLASSTDKDLILSPLVEVRNLINQSLDVVDVSRWTGDAQNADFISGQLRLLHDNISEAAQTLTGTDPARAWLTDPTDVNLFDPPLPSTLSFHLSIREAALLLELRSLDPAASPDPPMRTGFGLRERLAVAIGASRRPDHDEANETFEFKGEQVRVREKLRVESQDPSLMAVMAKLGALEHSVAFALTALDIVMGKESD
ncbi:MAG: hypothetical protein M1825_004797 [Sarcosagium campestre]|nr:MAG: hypothetical protein M1825_004797 [Sarcosagium campestre]